MSDWVMTGGGLREIRRDEESLVHPRSPSGPAAQRVHLLCCACQPQLLSSKPLHRNQVAGCMEEDEEER